jgi:hypothetical protein
MRSLWKKPTPSLKDILIQESELLNKDIMERQLNMIDAQNKLNAQIAKQQLIESWLRGLV